MEETAPAWCTAFTSGAFDTLVMNVDDTNGTLTGQVKQLDGRMAARKVTFQQLEAKTAETENSIKKVPTLSAAGSTGHASKGRRQIATIRRASSTL